MMTELSAALVVEILATAANLAFIILLIKEKIACWSFGIAGSALSVYLFVAAGLYSEAFLYLFYALMGCWGWLRWHRREVQHDNPVITWEPRRHARVIMTSCAVALGLGYCVYYLSDAQRPFFDAFTTTFSFVATYMEISKVLEAWVYWIVINLASVWLYQDRNLDIYAVLIGCYAVLSVWGFITWGKAYRAQGLA